MSEFLIAVFFFLVGVFKTNNYNFDDKFIVVSVSGVIEIIIVYIIYNIINNLLLKKKK